MTNPAAARSSFTAYGATLLLLLLASGSLPTTRADDEPTPTPTPTPTFLAGKIPPGLLRPVLQRPVPVPKSPPHPGAGGKKVGWNITGPRNASAHNITGVYNLTQQLNITPGRPHNITGQVSFSKHINVTGKSWRNVTNGPRNISVGESNVTGTFNVSDDLDISGGNITIVGGKQKSTGNFSVHAGKFNATGNYSVHQDLKITGGDINITSGLQNFSGSFKAAKKVNVTKGPTGGSGLTKWGVYNVSGEVDVNEETVNIAWGEPNGTAAAANATKWEKHNITGNLTFTKEVNVSWLANTSWWEEAEGGEGKKNKTAGPLKL